MSKNIQIAALVPYKIFPAKMGGEKGVALFYNALGELLPVIIISTKNNVLPPAFNARFIPALGNSILRYINPILFFRIKRILQKNQVTHLIIEHPYFGWLGILLKIFTPVCLAVHSHNIEATRFRSTGRWWWRVLWQYEKYTHRSADINFFITDEDRQFAISNFKLAAHRCFTITYGFDLKSIPSREEKAAAKKQLQEKYNLSPAENILLFNGSLHYKPNLDALDNILGHINPILLLHKNFKYRIIICGKNLPEAYNDLKNYKESNIIFAGFVPDINMYFYGADIFINPVTDGGGIKTKLVESLGSDLSCVSTLSGAFGVPAAVVKNKMITVPDGDWQQFAQAIQAINVTENTPTAFFNHFYWGNIAEKAAVVLKANCKR
ncbi:MAG: glycosyltransferase [Ferruginibacter sp.]